MNQPSITITSRTENLDRVRSFISQAATGYGFDQEAVGNIVLAVDEACTNIIKHAYEFLPTGVIELVVGIRDNQFEILITDRGKSFNPDEVRPLNVAEFIQKPRRGGLGIHLMRRMMDEVRFASVPGVRNEVRLIKYLHPINESH